MTLFGLEATALALNMNFVKGAERFISQAERGTNALVHTVATVPKNNPPVVQYGKFVPVKNYLVAKGKEGHLNVAYVRGTSLTCHIRTPEDLVPKLQGFAFAPNSFATREEEHLLQTRVVQNFSAECEKKFERLSPSNLGYYIVGITKAIKRPHISQDPVQAVPFTLLDKRIPEASVPTKLMRLVDWNPKDDRV